MYYTDTKEEKEDILLNHLMKNYSFTYEESYLYGETFAFTQGSLRIQSSNSKSQLIRLKMAVHISKFLRNVFSIIKTLTILAI